MARAWSIPAHPVDPNAERKEWRFLLSELSAWMRSKPKASTTRYTETLIINKHLLPRWEVVLAVEMKALAIEEWLKHVSVDSQGGEGQEWDSLTKWRRVMSDIFLHGQKHDLIPGLCNPMDNADVKASSSAFVPVNLTPKETFLMLNTLPLLQQTMEILDAATAIRYS
jgi:hypothetical protein